MLKPLSTLCAVINHLMHTLRTWLITAHKHAMSSRADVCTVALIQNKTSVITIFHIALLSYTSIQHYNISTESKNFCHSIWKLSDLLCSLSMQSFFIQCMNMSNYGNPMQGSSSSWLWSTFNHKVVFKNQEYHWLLMQLQFWIIGLEIIINNNRHELV